MLQERSNAVRGQPLQGIDAKEDLGTTTVPSG